MLVESMNEYLEILTGHVYDNDKVVTYKWLSKELEVHVNIAKQVLWEFWQRHKGKNNIECTVMLIGNLKSGGMRVEVVRESNLPVAKEKFSDIKSEHLYSIQKSIPDLESLAMCDKGDIRFSAIKCNESIERSDEELAILRWGQLFKDCPVPIEGEKLKSKDKPKEIQISKSPEHKEITSKKPANKKTTPVSQKTGFNNLFTKVSNKEKNTNTSPSNSMNTTKENLQSSVGEQSSSSKGSQAPITVKKDKKSLESFFERNAGAIKDTHSQSSVPKDQIDSNIKNNIKDNKRTQVISTKNNSNNQSKEKSRGKKRNRSKESDHMVKKRKRIIVNDDLSDSQNEDEEMRSESELEPEPEPEPEVEIIQDKKKQSPPPHIIDNKGRARVLKMVDKTYEEDGFLVTKKVHVYESCSEDEVDIVKTQAPKKQVSTSEPKAQIKKKQTTLTNFFKKS